MMTPDEKMLRIKVAGTVVLALILGTLLAFGYLDEPGFLTAWKSISLGG